MSTATINNPFSIIESSGPLAAIPLAAIVIIEKRTLIRDCLSRCLADEIRCPVVAFPDVKSLQELSPSYRPSLIIVSAIGASKEAEHVDEIIRELNQSGNRAPIAVLSDSDDIGRVTDSLGHGVHGHIPTGTTLDVAVKAMQLVLVGGVYVPASNFFTAPRSVAKGDSGDEQKTGLTERQIAVLGAVRQGKPNKTIARELNISEDTVKIHLRNVMRKLGVKNRTEAAMKSNKP